MHARTFQAADSSAALAQVKAELGPEAVILDTRSIVKDGRRMCEITATVDTDQDPAAGQGPMAGRGRGPLRGDAGAQSMAAGWQREWTEIKDCLATLAGRQLDKSQLPPRQRQALEHLERQEVEQAVLLRLYNRLLTDKQTSLLGMLGETVPCKPLTSAGWSQKLHAVAGPYGVGKTSTVLRLALAARDENPDGHYCLVNADLRQAKGKLVLRHYAELSGFAYREADTAEAMARVLAEAGNFERMFIDLPGLPGKAGPGTLARRLDELGLRNMDGLACHLVLSAVYGRAQLAAYLETFLCDGAMSLIWTKLDEAVTHGAMINTAVQCGLPISALGYGPGIRDSLAPAENMHLWRLIFKHQLPGAATTSAPQA